MGYYHRQRNDSSKAHMAWASLKANRSYIVKQQYTSEVTPQYKAATKARNVRYTIEENFDKYPEVREDYLAWRDKQNPIQLATFAGIFHALHPQSMFDIRKAEIREDW